MGVGALRIWWCWVPVAGCAHKARQASTPSEGACEPCPVRRMCRWHVDRWSGLFGGDWGVPVGRTCLHRLPRGGRLDRASETHHFCLDSDPDSLLLHHPSGLSDCLLTALERGPIFSHNQTYTSVQSRREKVDVGLFCKHQGCLLGGCVTIHGVARAVACGAMWFLSPVPVPVR